jgi:hypothetical protein
MSVSIILDDDSRFSMDISEVNGEFTFSVWEIFPSFRRHVAEGVRKDLKSAFLAGSNAVASRM